MIELPKANESKYKTTKAQVDIIDHMKTRIKNSIIASSEAGQYSCTVILPTNEKVTTNLFNWVKEAGYLVRIHNDGQNNYLHINW